MSEHIILEQSESKEQEENSRNSLPKTRSRGPVLDAPNVQEKILEYRGRTEAKKRFYQGQDQYCGQKTSVIVTENTSIRGQTAGIVASERKHSHWRIPALRSVNVSIPTGGYQYCGQ
ncbi:hypothetical protein Avbf_14083 [Armadillidium vulgare]|nr:hypothetical protein Avbf_14083 [Armadillidium vulgare]